MKIEKINRQISPGNFTVGKIQRTPENHISADNSVGKIQRTPENHISADNSVKNINYLNIKIVTTCVNYDDYLFYTLPHNLKINKNITVLTSSSDENTIKICKDNGVDTIFINGLGEKNKPFNWTLSYNTFLDKNPNELVCIIDSDILLPNNFMHYLKQLDIQPGKLFYTERIYLPMDYSKIHENILNVCKSENYHEFGFSNLGANAWGYFLLFYNNGKRFDYVAGHDINFSNKFEKILLPKEFAVAHIPHGYWSDWGANFNGRVTERIRITV